MTGRRSAPRHHGAAPRPNRVLLAVAARWPIALAATLALIGTLLTAPLRTSVASAAGSARMRPGLGTWLSGHTTFVGYYLALVGGKWVKVYCVSPAKRTPSHIGLTTVTRLSGTSTAVSGELAETLAAHGNAASAHQAEAVSQALNYEIGNRAAVAQRSRSLSRSVRSLAMRYVAEARRYRGGYQLGLHLSAAPLPGQSGHATVTLRGPRGGRAARITVSSTRNVSLPASVRTDAAGRATFTYRTTSTGEVRIGAAAAALPPGTLRASAPSRSAQRMLSWSPAVSLHASARYRGQVAGMSARYECSSTCDGNPVATLTACAAAGTYPSSITYHYGQETHEVDFPASRTRYCQDWAARVHDRDTVAASWRFRTPSGWTAPVPAGGSFRVDCPPVPPVAVLVSYDCHIAGFTVLLGRQSGGRLLPLRNETSHEMVLVLDGARSARFFLAPGETAAPQSFPVDCGSAAVIQVRAGVQRGNGTFNYGASARVVLP
jgi:hypothetical protein